MPVVVKGKRVVEKASGKVVKTHKSTAKAKKQASAINIAHARKKGHKIPRKK